MNNLNIIRYTILRLHDRRQMTKSLGAPVANAAGVGGNIMRDETGVVGGPSHMRESDFYSVSNGKTPICTHSTTFLSC